MNVAPVSLIASAIIEDAWDVITQCTEPLITMSDPTWSVDLEDNDLYIEARCNGLSGFMHFLTSRSDLTEILAHYAEHGEVRHTPEEGWILTLQRTGSVVGSYFDPHLGSEIRFAFDSPDGTAANTLAAELQTVLDNSPEDW